MAAVMVSVKLVSPQVSFIARAPRKLSSNQAATSGSVNFNAGLLYDCCPSLRFRCDERSKFCRRAYSRLQPDLGQARLHFGGFQAVINRGVQLADDGFRYVGGSNDASPKVLDKPRE